MKTAKNRIIVSPNWSDDFVTLQHRTSLVKSILELYLCILVNDLRYYKLYFNGYCTPDQFCDCLCIFLKNYNTSVTSKICFLLGNSNTITQYRETTQNHTFWEDTTPLLQGHRVESIGSLKTGNNGKCSQFKKSENTFIDSEKKERN